MLSRLNRIRILLFLIFLTSIITSKIFSLLNPAAAYCSALGYKYVIKNTPQGQVGFCILPNGEEVNAWDFYQGKVALNYSYCAKIGLKPVYVENGSYLACKFPNGTLIPVYKLINLSLRERKCGDGICEPGENYFNCPQDCPSGSLDGVCDKVPDGICDPDCHGKYDPDCLLNCSKNGMLDPECYQKPWLDLDCKNIDYPCFSTPYIVSGEPLDYLKKMANCDMCNHNGICDPGENWYNCPSDCKPCVNNITCPNGYIKVCNCYGVNVCVPITYQPTIPNISMNITNVTYIRKKITYKKAPWVLKIVIVLLIIAGATALYLYEKNRK